MKKSLYSFDYPPYVYLSTVVRHYPCAAALYMDLWSSRDDENKVWVRKKDVESDFLTSSAKFRNHLRMLIVEGLVNVHETKKGISIELTNYVDESDEGEPIGC